MYTSTVLGEGKCVLFREVSLIRGVLFREVTVYVYFENTYHMKLTYKNFNKDNDIVVTVINTTPQSLIP